MFGTEFVHRRIKTREIFDLASEAYVDMRRAAHRAKAAADTAASSDSDDADSDGATTMTTRRRRRPGSSPLPKRASSASQLDDGAGRPGAASCVAAPIHGRPPDTAAAAADAAAVLVSAPARVPRAVAEHEQTQQRAHDAITQVSAPPSATMRTGPPPTVRGNLHGPREVVGEHRRRPPSVHGPAGPLRSGGHDRGCQPAAREGTRGAVGRTPLGSETPASYEASADPDARFNPSHGGAAVSPRGPPAKGSTRHPPSRGPTIPV